MENNIIIRKAGVNDLEDILRLNMELFRKEYDEFDKSLNLEWPYNEGKKYFEERIASEDSFVEIAETDGKVIGYLCGGVVKRLFYRKKAKYAELENMLVEENFRGKGIGTKLIKDFINWCKREKIDCISLATSAENNQAINCYRKNGFKDKDLILEMHLNSWE